MSIASEITRLQNDSAAISAAIAAKGVTVPAGSGYDDYAGLIASIPAGGGDLPDWIKDDDTHLWINIESADQLDQQVRIRMIGTIDWGDGNTTSVNVSTYTTFSHTYAAVGKYRIDLKPASGTFYLGGASSSYNVMGERSNRARKIQVLYQLEIGKKQITYISAYAFYRCTALRRLYVPKNITGIGAQICYFCFSLMDVVFEDETKITNASLSSVFYYAINLRTSFSHWFGATETSNTFYYCQCVEEVTIPDTVTTVGASSFAYMLSLKRLRCLPTTPPTVSNANAFTSLPATCVIEVPAGKLAAYQSANIWSSYASQMVEASS